MGGSNTRGQVRTGMRIQDDSWSSPLIQSCWKVAWPATAVAEDRAARANPKDLILMGFGKG